MRKKKRNFQDDRSLRRQAVGDTRFAVTAEAEIEGKKISGKLTDFHFLGAGIQVLDGDLESLDSPVLSEMALKLGSTWINDAAKVRVCWSNPALNTFGVQFLAEDPPEDDSLVKVSCVKPTISCVDPFHVGRIIVGEVVALGMKSIVIESSLTNQFLLPGSLLKDCELYFPSLGKSRVTCRVVSANLTTDERAQFMVSVEETDDQYSQLFLRYNLAFESRSTLDWSKLHQKSIPRNLKDLLTFRKVANAIEYLKVLKLRLAAYKARDEELVTANVKDMGDGLAGEGEIIGGYLGGSMVCTMELRFGAQGHRLRVEDWISREELSKHLDITQAMEVNKLAIDPSLQGTDIVMGIMQRLSTIAGSNGGLYFLFSATDEMRKQYLAVGGIDVGVSYPHPYLKKTNLHIMIFPREVYSQGSGMNPYFWLRVYSQVNDFLAGHGFDQKKVMSVGDKAATMVYRKLHEVRKKLKKSKKK